MKSNGVVKSLKGLALSLLCVGLAACNFESDKPLIPDVQAAYPLPMNTVVHPYAQNPDDPQKWDLWTIGAMLSPGQTARLGEKYEGADPSENMDIEDMRYAYPDIYRLFADLQVQPAKPGYWIGESWMMFADLGNSPTEYMFQIRIKSELEDGTTDTTFYFGTAKMVGKDRMFLSLPDVDDLPGYMYANLGCTNGERSSSCLKLDTFENMKAAVDATPRDYKFFLKIGA